MLLGNSIWGGPGRRDRLFELPEYVTLATQMGEALGGKVVRLGSLGNKPHKFVWYNCTHEEFSRLTAGKRVGEAWARGRWLFLPLEPGYRLVLGECGGQVLYHRASAPLPKSFHLCLESEDGSALTAMTQMWAAMELFEAGRELERQYIKDMRPTPAEPEFTFDYFSRLVDRLASGEKRSVKGLLTQEQLIPGLGNAIAQDIMYRARLHPRRLLPDLDPVQRRALYEAILATVRQVIAQGGRNDETDLYGARGRYVRLMDRQAAGRPCPECGTVIEKMQYLGGACYFCPHCQV